jgi:hypothetical protein
MVKGLSIMFSSNVCSRTIAITVKIYSMFMPVRNFLRNLNNLGSLFDFFPSGHLRIIPIMPKAFLDYRM